MNDLLKQAKELQNELIKHRRYIHQNAEVDIDLPITTAYVLKTLKEYGYEPKEITKGGIVAVAGKKEGKTFLLRADMDALPIIEETDLAFKSSTENMHACGHDMHTAMLLGAAKLLKDNEELLEGKVKLMFQPAEETLIGAENMIQAGLLENPKVDAGMMIHVTNASPEKTGTVVVLGPGVVAASSDWFHITINGVGGHGARPYETVDPLTVLAHLHTGLSVINSRELKSTDDSVFTICHMQGGSTSNVIPDSAFLRGTIRTFNEESREFIKKRIKEISEGIAKTFRAEVVVEFPVSCPMVQNDSQIYKDFMACTTELLGEGGILDLAERDGQTNVRTTGSEDFGYVSKLIPTVSANLVAGCLTEGYEYKLHHPKAIFDENPLYIGAAVYTNMAIQWLKKEAVK